MDIRINKKASELSLKHFENLKIYDKLFLTYYHLL